ncbi:vancomycin resistance histidine kinase VanS [Clostridium beijerinckii]|uniref:histidine kinase n=1 Tax=Clostridium beijerinckii TaxID=1520 RepID=A0A1S9N3G1_CLOBE|nr:vancomycin resistance histidine kinase VanS [Clostridium beijerinckii]MZK57024.1 vancomycin resistance histidine kinase VanS [Clostridium beijerinckii]MZK67235.1 vancomycin resistance histidine kinase VanS [Clostridium beijerinckii]MZK72862.1 vancomycin resistance histidine kinase VanS [Clostridium beijerinckii]MZK82458.1 vancomycin resistance histidine kinase VanS [Clostridium beijerinckii]
MKLKSNKKGNYTNLKRKAFLQMLLIAVAATVTVFLLRYILHGKIGDRIVQFLVKAFNFDNSDAQTIYQLVIRNNMDIILFVVTLIFLVILFLFSVSSWLTKYFDEISAGMDKLSEESDDEITLSPELDFMENKLNQIKSNLEKQKKAALDAEQRKNDLVVYLAHDIKTPLTSVIGYLSLLDEASDMPPEQKAKYVGITLEKAYRLEELINEFFEITRFNLQTIILNKEKINLLFMLQQLADEFYPMLTAQEKKVSVNVPDGLVLLGDADKLARVFNNILKNAIAYSYENSIIDISAKQQQKNIVITFINQGNPIPQGKLDTIFEKFYRLDSARSTNTGGAGLGLAIAQEIVKAHNGTISVESNLENTTFTISIPS